MSRILVLDDEPMISLMLQEWLEELRHEVVGPAMSVPVALDLIKSARPDAALLDLTVGKENSYQVADALSVLGKPFAFTTGYSAASVADSYRHVPVMRKPFDFQSVRKMLDSLLTQAAQP
jgi:CheY-like chemotaxis protein